MEILESVSASGQRQFLYSLWKHFQLPCVRPRAVNLLLSIPGGGSKEEGLWSHGGLQPTGHDVMWACPHSVPLCQQTVQVPVYSEQEYQLYLHDDAWTKAETDHLFDLSRRFDLRFVVIHDRYDHQQFKVSWCRAFACVHNLWAWQAHCLQVIPSTCP